MSSVDEILNKLRTKARTDQLQGMSKYGIRIENRLGVSIPDTRALAKEIWKDHGLALALWESGVADAKILAAMIDEPERLTEAQMEQWVKSIDSWDICDQVCMNLFEKTPLAWKKILDWSKREEEFVRRAAFSLVACLAWHDRTAEDEAFVKLLPVIKQGAMDQRNYVKKAVNWALRNIGKRNLNLNKATIEVAKDLLRMESRSARWVASDALRELEGEAVQGRLRKKATN